jgi:(p)ppGpp synthase/HD superfamily hydrolase
MKSSKKIDLLKYKQAIDLSYSFYKDKYRKGIKMPYFTYLSSVSNLIIENNGNTDEVIAALFHDLFEFENNNKRLNQIKRKFGNKVLNIVKQCSSLDILNEKFIENKKKFLDSMSKMSQSSLLVSLCDKLHSINCIINDYNKIGKKIWKNHDLSSEETNWYYKSLCKNFKKFLKNHKSLKDKFQRNINELEFLIKK